MRPSNQQVPSVKQLNPRQLEAVKSISHPTLVLAGAGSGKTSVITEKIAYLVRDCGYQANRIAAVTFTNKAAKEMKERVSKLLDKKLSRGLMVSTFHTLGLTIIRKELPLLGLRDGFSIFDTEDAKSLLKELMIQGGNLDTDLLDFILQTISSMKNDMLSPEQAIVQANSDQEQQIAQIYLSYQQALQAYNAVDFDDLIRMPVALLQNDATVRERWQQKIRYLLVDEYQDTNSSQYELVKLLIGDGYHLTVVGDDDQSIYAWRGARPENLAQLQTDYSTLKLIKLEQNYRSTSAILHCANTLIANNPHVFEKKLWSQSEKDSSIRILKTTNDKVEAETVVNDIIHHRLMHQSHYADYAILYRGNHQSRAMEMALQQADLPYKLTGGISFFSRSEVKDIMAYLRLLVNPADDSSFLRIINVPRRKIGSTTLQQLAQTASTLNSSLYDAIEAHCSSGEHNHAGSQSLLEFYQWLQNIMQQCENYNPIDIIREMVDDIGFEAWLHQNSASANAAQKRMQNVEFLIDNLQYALHREQEDNDEADIKDAVNRLILRDMLERQAEEKEDDAIQLMTLHASKGLEFPNIYLIGMEEEILPHRSSIEQDTIEEERRLAYVGITRAQVNLCMTYAAKRKQFGEVSDTTHSRFLDELPPDNIVWQGHEEFTEQDSRQMGNDILGSLSQKLAQSPSRK